MFVRKILMTIKTSLKKQSVIQVQEQITNYISFFRSWKIRNVDKNFDRTRSPTTFGLACICFVEQIAYIFKFEFFRT